MDNWLLLAVSTLGLVALIVFACVAKGTKFGPYNTGTLVLVLLSTLAAVLLAGGKFEGKEIANLFFAVAGFAGGLLKKDDKATGAKPGD